MTRRRAAGEPETPRGPAGVPDAAPGAAGAPKEADHPAGNDVEEEEEERQVERDLDELLADVRRERDEYLDLAQRTKADFENYRRRAARDAEEAERRGKRDLARELVPALDNLERALRAAGIDPDAEDAAAAAEKVSGDGGGLGHGVLLVYRDLRSTLQRVGVEAYDPVGEKFDPTWHEAVATRPAEGEESGVVLETVDKGYRFDGQVIRAARVVVSQ